MFNVIGGCAYGANDRFGIAVLMPTYRIIGAVTSAKRWKRKKYASTTPWDSDSQLSRIGLICGMIRDKIFAEVVHTRFSVR
jgi:hypothetical protein